MKRNSRSPKTVALLLALIMIVSIFSVACSQPAEITTTEPAAAPAEPAQQPAEGAAAPEEAVEEDGLPVFDDILKVRVGIGPYPMYQVFSVAKEWGLDKICGLDIEIQSFVNTVPNYQACVRGDIDVSFGCVDEQVAVMNGVPDIRHFAPLGFYKGFFFVGRADSIKSWDDLKAEMGIEAAREYRRNEFKGKIINIIPAKEPLVVDMLEQVGLTADDVTFMEFADDQKGATAFLAGTGDFYIGGIPQQTNLLKQGGDKFVNAGGYEILGPAGAWYDTFSSTDSFMIDNREAALRTLALIYLAENKFNENPEAFAEVAAAALSKVSGAEFSVEEYLDMQLIYDEFQTVELCIERVYNPDSDYYWRKPVEYCLTNAIKKGTIDSSFTADKYFGEAEVLFNELLAREDLMKIINEG